MPTIDLSKDISWQAIFDIVPDNQNTQPKTGVVQTVGELDGDQFTLRTLPGRADLIYQQIIKEPEQLQFPAHINVLNSYISKANLFLQKFQNISDIEITRLAFGAELHLLRSDRDSAYKTLDRLLHALTIDETSSDLQYSINRKRKSSLIPEVEINRLSQWSSQRLNISVSHDNPEKLQKVHESFVCRLVLDINTAPSEKVILPINNLVSIYTELVELGKEIAEFGDIP
jgi:hypothetical protein